MQNLKYIIIATKYNNALFGYDYSVQTGQHKGYISKTMGYVEVDFLK